MAYTMQDPRKQQQPGLAGAGALRGALGLPQTNPALATAAGPSAAPAGTQGPSAAPAAPKPAAAAPTQRQGGHVNFDRVLSAARPAVDRLGQQAVSNVRGKVDGYNTALRGAETVFRQKANEGAERLQPGEDPYAAAGRLTGKYAGPKDLAGAGVDVVALAQQQKDAADMLANTNTLGGMGVALGYGEKDRSGAAAWDAMLAGAGAGQQLEQMRGGVGALRESLGLAQKGAGEQADRIAALNASEYGAAQQGVAAADAAKAEAARKRRNEGTRKNRERFYEETGEGRGRNKGDLNP